MIFNSIFSPWTKTIMLLLHTDRVPEPYRKEFAHVHWSHKPKMDSTGGWIANCYMGKQGRWLFTTCTGDFFEEWNDITHQTHIRIFEELTACGRLSCWGSFLTLVGSSGLMRILWMSGIIPSKTPVLKPLVLQIFWFEFGDWFRSILQKSHL